MPDLTGMTLGPYRIVERIGRGGMATVYKAYHPTMDRNVALKILPEQYADDPDFRARFEREAKVVARLQHPHILPVFDYGQERDISYLAMPYIPTGTLKDYIAQGTHDLKEVARILSQIAGALDYAHQQGILHRDIKPDNVLFDESGNALLTDFGLTRMVEGGSSLTGTNVIGTPAYMSPEQGRGLALDRRSDLYSLGVILYEMVVGEVPFSADTPVAVIFKHVSDPLPMPRARQPHLHEAIENIILKALAKEPDQRFSSGGEMAQAFSQAVNAPSTIMDTPSGSGEGTVIGVQTAVDMPDTDTQLLAPPERRLPRRVLGLMGLVVLVIIIAALGSGLFAPAEPLPTLIAALAATEEPTFTDTPTVTKTATEAPTATDTATATRTPTATETSDPLVIARATRSAELTMTSEREAILALEQTATATLWTDTPTPTVTPSNTPTPTRTDTPAHTATLTPSNTPTATRTPTITPSSIPTATRTPTNTATYTLTSSPTATVTLSSTPTNTATNTATATYTPSNTPTPFGGGTGRLALNRGDDGKAVIIVLDNEGTPEQVTDSDANSYRPVYSPDGTKIAFYADGEGDLEIYVMDADGSNKQKLTDNQAVDALPVFSPDGRKIAFHSNRSGDFDIYVMNVDGSNVQRLTNNTIHDAIPSWSPDSRQISFHSTRDGDGEIYVMNVDGSNVRQLTNHDAADWAAAWSPDGRMIAFVSDRDALDCTQGCKNDIYVMDIDGNNVRRLTSHDADDMRPRWSPDGTMIAFTSERIEPDCVESCDFRTYVIHLDSGEVQRLTVHDGTEGDAFWQPGG